MENTIPKNLKEAIKQGYKISDEKYTSGYVSRKTHTDNLEVFESSQNGKRKGQLYALSPSFNSTRYCIKQYLVKG